MFYSTHGDPELQLHQEACPPLFQSNDGYDDKAPSNGTKEAEVSYHNHQFVGGGEQWFKQSTMCAPLFSVDGRTVTNVVPQY